VVKKDKEKRHAAPITKGVAIYGRDHREPGNGKSFLI
jgi:hypothetical protein